MKTIEQLKTRIKELGHLAADCSRKAVELKHSDQHQSKELMRQAYEASKRCQILIQELNRQQN